MFKMDWITKNGALNLHHVTNVGFMEISRKLMYLFLIFLQLYR